MREKREAMSGEERCQPCLDRLHHTPLPQTHQEDLDPALLRLCQHIIQPPQHALVERHGACGRRLLGHRVAARGGEGEKALGLQRSPITLGLASMCPLLLHSHFVDGKCVDAQQGEASADRLVQHAPHRLWRMVVDRATGCQRWLCCGSVRSGTGHQAPLAPTWGPVNAFSGPGGSTR